MRAGLIALILALGAASGALAGGKAFGPEPSPTPSPTPPITQKFAETKGQFTRALKPLPRIPLKPKPRLHQPDEVEAGAILASVEDVSAVSVRAVDGSVRLAHQGDGLEPGDGFQTGERGTVRVAWERGIQILIPPGALVRVGQENVVGPNGGIGVPSVEIEQGEVRILVESLPQDELDEDLLPPLKLVVHTKGGVIGVRGTDFIVAVADDKTEVHMIKGIIEAAHEAKALGLGGVMHAGASEMLELVDGRPIQPAEHYEAGALLREFHDRHSRMEELWNQAVRDAKTKGLKPMFYAVKALKVDKVNLENGFAATWVRAQADAEDEYARKWRLRAEGRQDESGKGQRLKRLRKHRQERKVEPKE